VHRPTCSFADDSQSTGHRSIWVLVNIWRASTWGKFSGTILLILQPRNIVPLIPYMQAVKTPCRSWCCGLWSLILIDWCSHAGLSLTGLSASTVWYQARGCSWIWPLCVSDGLLLHKLLTRVAVSFWCTDARSPSSPSVVNWWHENWELADPRHIQQRNGNHGSRVLVVPPPMWLGSVQRLTCYDF